MCSKISPNAPATDAHTHLSAGGCALSVATCCPHCLRSVASTLAATSTSPARLLAAGEACSRAPLSRSWAGVYLHAPARRASSFSPHTEALLPPKGRCFSSLAAARLTDPALLFMSCSDNGYGTIYSQRLW